MPLSLNQKKKLAKITSPTSLATLTVDELKRYMDHLGVAYASTDTLAQSKTKLVNFSKRNNYVVDVTEID